MGYPDIQVKEVDFQQVATLVRRYLYAVFPFSFVDVIHSNPGQVRIKFYMYYRGEDFMREADFDVMVYRSGERPRIVEAFAARLVDEITREMTDRCAQKITT